MSKAKFAAAREFIREKKYNEARRILRTVDHPTAKEWLVRIDKLDPSYVSPPPPPPEFNRPSSQFYGNSSYRTEQERYYRAENRSRRLRHIGAGIQLLGVGIVSLVSFFVLGFFGKPVSGNTIQLGLECLFVPIAVVCLIAGFIKITGRD